VDVLDAILDFIMSIPERLYDLLPDSPVLSLSLNSYSKELSMLNWFVPFDYFMTIFAVFLGVFGATILVRAALRYFGVLS
jgi:hypothetical protein